MAKQEYVIDVVARDFASPTFDKIGRNGNGMAERLRSAGEVSDINPLKKLGKFIGGASDIAGLGEIDDKADKARAAAASDYAVEVKKGVAAETAALDVDRQRVLSLQEQRLAARELFDELRKIDAREKEQAGAAPRSAHQDIHATADEDREVAQRKYQEAVKQTNDLTIKADAAEKTHAAAIATKSQATAEYAKKLKQVDEAEAAARKSALADTRVTRMAAAAGGTLLAIEAVNKLADAYDTANQKLEKGEIAAGMFWGEFAKGLPIIGGIVGGFEKTMLVVTGTAAKMRAINEEAAKTQAVVQGRIDARKNVDDVISKNANTGEGEAARISREAKEKLDEIAKVRAGAKGVAALDPERDAKLAAEERAIIEKRNADLAKIANDAHDKQLATRKQFDGEMRQAQTDANAAEATLATTRLRDQGRELDASLVEIRSKYAAQREQLAADRAALRDETGLGDKERLARQAALDRRGDALNAQQGAEEGGARKSAAVSNAEKVREINLDSLRQMAEGGDKEAERQLKLVDIAEKYRQKREEINKLLANGSLSDADRKALQESLGTLTASEQRERAGVDQRKPVTVQGRNVAGSEDGRFTAMAVANGRQVEVLGDQKKIASDTLTEIKKHNELLAKVLAALNGPIIGGAT